MKSRNDFIKGLHAKEQFQQALAAARSPAERKMVSDMVESFVSGFADVLGPLIERAQNDPEFAAQLGRSLSEKQDVLSSEPLISGSI